MIALQLLVIAATLVLVAWSMAGTFRPRHAARRAARPAPTCVLEPPASGRRRRDPRLCPRRAVLAVAVAAGDRKVPVPLLLRALQFSAPGVRARTLDQARAALGELYEDGVIDLEPMRVPPGREAFYLRGPEGRVFGLATIAVSLEEARAELAGAGRVRAEGGAA